MGWEPGQEDGDGAGRDRPVPSRPDPRLAAFAHDSAVDPWSPPTPSGRLALLVDELSGPERRCPGASGDELIGLLQTWAAIESWAASAKLGVIREIMRREGPPSPGSDHGDLPETWSRSLRYELSGALACSTQSAESTASLAWQLAARLPRIGARLDDGTLTSPKARVVAETFGQLTDPDAAAAEAMIADQLAGKTYTQVLRLAEQAALTVDPGLTERWRKHAQKTDARVAFFREQAGTAGLSGRDLPPDEALAAMANVNVRAEEYKESDAFDDTPMDVLRAYAYLDLINGVAAADRIALTEQHGSGDDDGPGSGGPGSAGPGPGPRSGGPVTDKARDRRPADLVVPLMTMLGLAERPGEIHGFGLLDPALARQLALAAIASPRSEICLTVTSPEGYAIGHGCARPTRTSPRLEPAATPAALPARLNLTIPAGALASLPGHTGHTGHTGRAGPWSLTPRGRPEDPSGFGGWTLVLPGGREFAVRLDPVPVFACDHRYETHHYQPSDRLRHLVQIRDGTCTFPTCNRHARESDFEHALPYDQGGKTCACNAGARSRSCHQVKQSPGWNVTQPKPGWHRWETPAGRVYLQEPKRYPA